jgi:hypothetical protein
MLTPATTSAAPPTGAGVVRISSDTVGHGRAKRPVLRIVVLGERPRTITVPGGDVVGEPAFDPSGRRLALLRDDLRPVVVPLEGGRPVVLRRPRAPRLPSASRFRPGAWTLTWRARVTWAPDGRGFSVQAAIERDPPRFAGQLSETRATFCRVDRRRCTSLLDGAATDLVPLRGGGRLRIDAPVDRNEPSRRLPNQLGRRDQRRIERSLRDPLTTALAIETHGRPRSLVGSRGSMLRGALTVVSPAVTGPAGTLVLRARTARRPGFSEGIGDPVVFSTTDRLAPWLVTPGGRLRTVPLRLGVEPVGTLGDGRFVLGTGDARATPNRRPDEPSTTITTLDRRGRLAPLLVGGRPLSPLALAVDAGLPDTFAAGATTFRATADADGRALLVVLADGGSGDTFFAPPDFAVVRVPLDGSGPAQLIDHAWGATYALR